MFRKAFLAIFFICIFFIGYSQIPIGQWREHLPYHNATSLADDGNNRIYASTPNSIFYYDKKDFSIHKLSSVNRLSDIGVSTIAFDINTQTLVIAYNNGNLDLMHDDIVYNISDIKRKAIIGSKSINHILIFNSKAYLSTDFGIVVIDIKKKEISDTYYIGPNAQSLKVNQLIIYNDTFYAATISGIYYVDFQNPNLSDFQSWNQITGISNYNNEFNFFTEYKNNLIVNYKGLVYSSDTLYELKNNKWDYLLPHIHGPITVLKGIGDTLLVGSTFGLNYYYNNLVDSFIVFDYNQPNTGQIMPKPHDALIDKNHITWIADEDYSLVINPQAWNYQFIIPSGPFSQSVWDMSVEGGNLWVASGGYQVTGANSYLKQGIYKFNNEDWHSWINSKTSFLDTVDDVVSVAVNPQNPNEVYFGTWGQGMIKLSKDQFSASYSPTNSTLQYASNRAGFVGISGMKFDAEGNLWIANTASSQGLSRLSPDGKWTAFNLAPLISEDMTGQIEIDDYNQKWIVIQRGKGILVFNDNFTPDISYDDKKILLTSMVGNGNLPSSTVYCLAKDQDGEMWVGTSKGICVFYAPELIFSGNEFDAQQIYVEQAGISQYLLESEEVTSIAIDGANRKWLGTRNAGVFLMSADGTQQIYHFTIENSPILSNNILKITIDQNSGEVFFATEKGIISYRNDATFGQDIHNEVKVFPNPVKPGYSGSIAISGLVNNAVVKITDASGNLVIETVANGGTATWNGLNAMGQKVTTGVYMVFSSNEDGSETFVSKILFIQ